MNAKKLCHIAPLPPNWLFLNGKFQNIPIPAATEGKGNSKGRGVQKDAISEGGGGVVSWGLFPGPLSKTGKLLKTNVAALLSKLAVILLLTVF